jgi:murein DD-endopeptidase MepM/ murein hydrolase activator NlpD
VATIGLGASAGAVGTQRAIAPKRQIVLTMPAAAVAVRTDDLMPEGDALRWPVPGDVTGVFGEPRAGHMHEGIDIPNPVGTPIAAAGGGKIVMREWQDGYGKYTCIAHVEILTCYGHQSRFGHVELGDRVEQGEVIGYTGDSGTSEAPHLHFEVRRGRLPWGKPVDPLKYLPREPDRLPVP